jgi:transcriptional regulator with XRE-family HTH domain
LAKQKSEKVLHNRIKIVLAEKNFQQSDLVELTGLSRTTISNYCRNTAQPSLETLRMIAVVLNVNAQHLVVPTPEGDEK